MANILEKKILLVPNLPGNYRHGKTAQSTTSPTYLPIYLTQIIKPPIFSSQLLTQGGYMCPMGKGPLKQAICREGHKEDPAHVRSDRHLSSTAVKDACSQVSIMHTGRQLRAKALAIPKPVFGPRSFLLPVLNNLGREGRREETTGEIREADLERSNMLNWYKGISAFIWFLISSN